MYWRENISDGSSRTEDDEVECVVDERPDPVDSTFTLLFLAASSSFCRLWTSSTGVGSGDTEDEPALLSRSSKRLLSFLPIGR